MRAPFLLVAYGNTLRGDDGIASAVAVEVAGMVPAGLLEVITAFQLLPELAPALAGRQLVLFLDAAAGQEPGTLKVAPVSAVRSDSLSGPAFTHHFSPEALLALAALFDEAPPALLVTVGGARFGHGEGLSAPVRPAVGPAATIVRDLVLGRLATPPGPECAKVEDTGETPQGVPVR